MTPVWAVELAARFWSAAGEPPPFPRDLTSAVAIALGLRVVALPGLRLDSVRAWLGRAGIPCPAGEPDRLLRACLFARRGVGFVFVDAADPPAERRFSLAHEAAHFLRDYDAPRRAAAAKIGPAAVEVFDGVRPASADERLHAILRGVPVAAHVHLLHRDDAGRPRSNLEREAESAADCLAFELLAPARLLESETNAAAARTRLESEFGLPLTAATEYAESLYPPPEHEPVVKRWRHMK